jgi:hypothetical protein
MPSSYRPADRYLDTPLVPEDFAAVALLGSRLAGNEDGARPEVALHPIAFDSVPLSPLRLFKTI